MTYGVQQIDAPLTAHAVFLVLSLEPGEAAAATVRAALADLSGVVETVGFRDPAAMLSCTVGIGSGVWTAVTGTPPPAQLHAFRPVVGATYTAAATPGDLLVHLRSDRADLCFETQRLLMDRLRGAVRVEDETTGFRYFDQRDLLGFVDGTANPVGDDVPGATRVGEEDGLHAGGSYVVTQKYLHALDRWSSLPAEVQEQVIGRTKLDNVELDDAAAGQRSHKTLTTIVDDDGTERDILRDNMPFGSPGAGEFGTYFIGYCRDLWVIERMLERMYVGDPPGLHDRILDFSVAVTGTTYFAPSAAFLDALGTPTATAPPADGSLGIGGNRPSNHPPS
ncbi:Dyp-type peroxidase [Nocardioides kongjuensis]|uniref:Putative iron-dependent peroxidase n=1 Tax=Nocardioides kongjuensis TaxID=349522 RepID=A0A852RLB9_9ACTN|nr:Dyp-type peroxidase [Nocardioides kongjuensis]NYD28864.1 putative iron-dependent peroxidase [Nocardioides kongjuensis]